MYNQSQQIPIDRYLAQPMQFTAHNVPFVPRDAIELLGLSLQIMPAIAAAVATTLSAKASRSPLHVFVFNMHAQNNWQNQVFADSVKMAYYYTAISMYHNQFNDLNQAMGNAADKITACLGAEVLTANPNMAQMQGMAPNVLQSAQTLLNELAGIRNHIQSAIFEQSQRQQPPQYGAQPVHYSPGYGQPQHTGFPIQNHQAQPGQYYQNHGYIPPALDCQPSYGNQSNQSTLQSNGGGVFYYGDKPNAQQRAPVHAVTQTVEGDMSRYDYLLKNNRIYQPGNEQVQTPTQVHVQSSGGEYQQYSQKPPMLDQQSNGYPQTSFSPVQEASTQTPPLQRVPGQVPDRGLNLVDEVASPDPVMMIQPDTDFTEEINFEGKFHYDLYWPDEDYPYPEAINSRTQVRMSVFKHDAARGKDRVIYVPREMVMVDLTEEEMERNRHFITPASKALATVAAKRAPIDVNAIESAKPNQTPAQAVSPVKRKKVNHSMETIAERTKRRVNYQLISTESVDSAIDNARYLHKLTEDADKGDLTIHVRTGLHRAFISSKDYRNVLNDLSMSASFYVLCEKLNRYAKQGEEQGDAEFTELINQVNIYLSEKLGDLIKVKLGITNMTFGSFMEDAPNLFEFFKEHYGMKYTEALHKHQLTFIKNHMNINDDIDLGLEPPNTQTDKASSVTADVEFDPDADEEVPATAKVYTVGYEEPITVNYVDMCASELNLNLVKGLANLIESSAHPQLDAYITSIIDEVGTGEDYRHFIVTSDGYVFEVTIGLLGYMPGMPSYLIRQIR